jgi:hypothetical protein
MIIRTNVKADAIATNHNEKVANDKKTKNLAIKRGMIDTNRRDLIKMLTLTGVAGLLTVALIALSPVISASSPKAAGTTIVKAKSLQGLRLPTDSNAIISELGPGKAEVRFPNEEIGYIRPGRNEFKDEDDLVGYLAEVFPLIKEDKGGYRGSIKRVGKYQRINDYNRAVFTFGDPILDLITDENGILILGGSRIDLKSIELEESEQRGGGIVGVDSTPNATPPPTVPPSGCPSHTFWSPASNAYPKIRFRAWRRSYPGYWSEGSDIETWGKKFNSAEISSQYGFYGWGYVCVIAKIDSDHDTNDDYVDEYEWGIKAPRPAGHISNCRASWNGTTLSRDVCQGCTSGWQ